MSRTWSLGAAMLAISSAVGACGTRGDLSLGWLGGRVHSDAGDTSHGEDSNAATSTDGESDSAVDSTDVDSTDVNTADVDSTDVDTADVDSTDVDTADVSGPSSTPSPSSVDAAPPGSSSSPPTSSVCNEAIALPTERFDFSGEGVQVIDRMGGPSGELRGGATLTGTGSIELDGDDDYINLPNGLLSTKTSATLIVWASLVDGPAYWRLLDFGTSSGGEDPTGSTVGTTYVAITTETGLDPSGLALLVGHGGASSEDRALTDLSLEAPQVALGVVLDGETERATLYVDGVHVASTTLSAPLSELNDVNNWLGRSQYAADPHYPGTYTELRLYAEALSDCAMMTLAEWGPELTQ